MNSMLAVPSEAILEPLLSLFSTTIWVAYVFFVFPHFVEFHIFKHIFLSSPKTNYFPVIPLLIAVNHSTNLCLGCRFNQVSLILFILVHSSMKMLNRIKAIASHSKTPLKKNLPSANIHHLTSTSWPKLAVISSNVWHILQ